MLLLIAVQVSCAARTFVNNLTVIVYVPLHVSTGSSDNMMWVQSEEQVAGFAETV